jgi:hypothetical protein
VKNANQAVCRMSLNGSGLTILHEFPDGPEGFSFPMALAEDSNGRLYGTTLQGGLDEEGMLYGMGRDGSGYTVIYTFTGFDSDGEYPMGALAYGSFQDIGGVVYGTATFTPDKGSYGDFFSLAVNPTLLALPASQAGATNNEIFWQSWASGYNLQSATNLSSPTWINITGPKLSTTNNGVPLTGVQLTNTAPAAYYRLNYALP